ncbi:hypothetical protein CR513_49940, partial [Mucuna pruriens]
MEEEASGKESTLIFGKPFLMTTRTKIDVHAETLPMEFRDTLVQFNIFEARKHPVDGPNLRSFFSRTQCSQLWLSVKSDDVESERWSVNSSRHWPSCPRQRLSRDDVSRDNPARSQLSADRRYREGLSLSQTRK